MMQFAPLPYRVDGLDLVSAYAQGCVLSAQLVLIAMINHVS